MCKHNKSEGVKIILGTVHNPPGWHSRPVYRVSKAKAKDFVEALMYFAREFGLYPVGPRAKRPGQNGL